MRTVNLNGKMTRDTRNNVTTFYKGEKNESETTRLTEIRRKWYTK
jgi:hypothetical protein